MVARPLVLLALVLAPNAALAAEIQLNPGDDFCDVFNQAAPGDIITLAPGIYMGPCALTSGGAPGMPKTLRGADPGDGASIFYDGNSSNVLDVLASDIVIADISFGPTNADIDAIKIKDGSRITIESCHFTQIGGISISANSKDSDAVVILGNIFLNLQATGIYLGCQDGMSACAATGAVIEGNVFDAVDSQAVGYAMELKLDSFGVVRDNVIHDTKGPGIEIYGSTDLTRVSVVERNLVIGSRNNGTVEIGGGPAVVRNNIIIGGATAGLHVYDYQSRDLVRSIHVLGNTVVGDAGPAILLSDWAADRDLELTDNAAWQSAGAGPALPAAIPGVAMAGNVDCTPDPDACWLAAASRDFWPADASPLVGGGAAPTLGPPLEDDFCAQLRGGVPHAGALERTMSQGPGPLPLDFKTAFACPQADDTGDTPGSTADPTADPSTTSSSSTSSTTDTPTTGGSGPATGPVSGSTDAGSTAGSTDAGTTAGTIDDDSGCACRSGHAPSAIPLLALLALPRRRRR